MDGSLSTLKLSLYGNLLIDCSSFVALFWTFSIFPMSYFLYGHHTVAAHPSCDLTYDEVKGAKETAVKWEYKLNKASHKVVIIDLERQLQRIVVYFECSNENIRTLTTRQCTFLLTCFTDLQRQRIEQLRQEFSDEQKTLINEFETERALITEQNEREMRELQDIIYAMDQNFEEQDAEAKAEFQSQRDELKNKVQVSVIHLWV